LVTWRLIFLINLPVGIAGLMLLARLATAAADAVRLVGQVIAVVAMAGLTFGVFGAGAAGLTAPAVVVALTTAAAALVGPRAHREEVVVWRGAGPRRTLSVTPGVTVVSRRLIERSSSS
jgi:hypothetical protein